MEIVQENVVPMINRRRIININQTNVISCLNSSNFPPSKSAKNISQQGVSLFAHRGADVLVLGQGDSVETHLP